MGIRIGTGYDVHILKEGRKLIIGGVEIPYEKGLLGHSDADVLTHAVMDSMLGAAALGDIGRHFPDNDDSFKNICSITLLKKTSEILKENGFSVNNIDATIVAQRPKMAPYIEKMRKNIADAINTDIKNISIKATTTEGLGFEGEGKGISAQAVCTVLQ
ncbi:MAG: 2-C-methyl-D-erythritol 2,4-cyclodiphosphate synthase [Oscillospiraceae bacterium]|nr:2-C-methyl-D-erythritol 2,4-cyclodiphosphate synthase [Oscillospiraceae bacterium]